MATRAEIEARIADTLNRTDFTTRITIWFDRAYTAIQRRHNFKCMEVTETATVVVGQSVIAAPTDIKKSIQLFLYNPTTGFTVRFFGETNIDTLRFYRFSGQPVWPVVNECRSIFSAWYQSLEFYPEIGSGEDGYVLRYDYYRYITAADNDFFMTRGEDYLVYRALRESAPFLGADGRLPIWAQLEREAYEELAVSEIDQQTSGKLVMRG